MGLKERLYNLLPRGIENKAQTPDAKWGLPKDVDLWRHRKRDKDKKPLPMDSFFLGYDDEKKKIFWRDNRHVFTCAGNRSGKGVSLIIPNLYIYENSVFVLDPKGENARKTAEHRKDHLGQELIILDPFNTTGIETAISCFNPLDNLDPNDEDNIIDDVALIADSLIIVTGKDPYWSEMARYLLKALILTVIAPNWLAKKDMTLGTVREYQELSHVNIVEMQEAGEKKLKEDAQKKSEDSSKVGYSKRSALWDMMELIGKSNKVYGHIILGAVETFKNMADKELSGVLNNLSNQLEFLDSPKVQKVLRSSPFRMERLKQEKVSLYLCLPAGRMGTHKKWLRTLISLALMQFERAQNNVPVLMVLDEFPILGHMDDVQNAAGYIAGFDVKMWFIVQNISQIKEHYKDSWETLTGNCGVLTFFGNTEPSTLQYISQSLGNIGMTTEEIRLSNKHSPIEQEYRDVPLLAVHEIAPIFKRREPWEDERDGEQFGGMMLVVAAGQEPVILERGVYYKDEFFKSFDNGVK